MQISRLSLCSAKKLNRLLLLPKYSQKINSSTTTTTTSSVREYYLRLYSSSVGRTADPSVHSGPLEGDDLEEAVKAESATKQPNTKPSKENEAFVPPKSPGGSSQKIESTGVNPPIDPISQHKRHKSSINSAHNALIEDVSCSTIDVGPWPDEVKDEGAQAEDNREYFKHNKPSPLAEIEMADTRKPITRATDSPASSDITLYPAADGGVSVWRPEQLSTAEDSLLRARKIWEQNAMRGDPDSPHGRVLRQLRGENW